MAQCVGDLEASSGDSLCRLCRVPNGMKALSASQRQITRSLCTRPRLWQVETVALKGKRERHPRVQRGRKPLSRCARFLAGYGGRRAAAVFRPPRVGGGILQKFNSVSAELLVIHRVPDPGSRCRFALEQLSETLRAFYDLEPFGQGNPYRKQPLDCSGNRGGLIGRTGATWSHSVQERRVAKVHMVWNGREALARSRLPAV